MINDLTLPGEIPGILRRCSPCRVRRDPDDETFTDVPLDYGVVLAELSRGPNGGDVPGVWMTLDPYFPDEPDIAASWLHVDLTDATGRAHAAWWLADQVGIQTIDWNHGTDGAWWSSTGVPALADLDPNDPRLLDDGSRWVDAEALRLVCLHVAGRTA